MKSAQLLSLSLLAVACYAHSEPPIPGPSEAGQPPQHQASSPQTKAERDQRGTKAAPLVVEAVESEFDAADKQNAAKYREQEAATNRWLMLLTGGMLFVSSIQAWFFWTQLRLMDRSMVVAEKAAKSAAESVETMQDTARRQLRAYISINAASIEFPSPGVPKVTVSIKNTGQTPAHNVKHWIHQWIEFFPLRVDLPQPPGDLVMSCDVMGTGATHANSITHPKMIVKRDEDINIIGTPKGTIYVYGEITYSDVFGERHFSKYRYMYGGSERKTGNVLSACPEGNEAT